MSSYLKFDQVFISSLSQQMLLWKNRIFLGGLVSSNEEERTGMNIENAHMKQEIADMKQEIVDTSKR